jgi:thiol-disulfide isomerase/thioredoxin
MLRILLMLLVLPLTAAAGVVDDVRAAIAHNNVSNALEVLNGYKAQHGIDPEYVEALSWIARGELNSGEFAQARKFGQDTNKLTIQLLKNAPLDQDPRLAIALGASFEVQAQALAKQNQTPAAVLLLRQALQAYGATSIRARLQKNLNLLTLIGKPAPRLAIGEYLGPKPQPLTALKGSVVLLFFWAHWCGDCKAEAPVIARLQSELPPHDFVVIAPTQRYGYAGAQENISPQQETQYIEAVRQHYYSQLATAPVPVSQQNFDRYGASTTPTLVLLSRNGNVALYHPGAMAYGELRSEIDKLLKSR